ncbi:7847_t:CDS:2, partial [Acaulospora morrowiae]
SGDVLSSDEQMPDYIFYRNLWWDEGKLSEKAKWEEVTLPYVLAKGIDVEEYERRTEEFNIRGSVSNADVTGAKILGFGATRTRDINRGKEADASFRPKKPAVTAPNGSDRNEEPWPNLVVEVAYTETLGHVEEAEFKLF